MDQTSRTNLASHYECPVCFDYVRPPIFQCQNGHSVCSNCTPKLKCCPTCKGQLGVSRALFMEKMLDSVLFPCKSYSTGCQVTLLLIEMDAHEKNCAFLPYSCFICPWKGAVDKIVTHIQQVHPGTTMIQGNHGISLKKKCFSCKSNNLYMVDLEHENDELFWSSFSFSTVERKENK